MMGAETQINIKPQIVDTSEEAIKLFDPEQRGCYAEGEANMTYLIHSNGFRYEMNNCLIDEGIRDIIWNCRCLPRFYDAIDAIMPFRQKYSRLRSSLPYQNFAFLFYLDWSGRFLQIRHNIMKVVQSYATYLQGLP